MDKQFAASEVRRLSNRIPRSNDEIVDAQEALRAFADLLEADEKAVPVAWMVGNSKAGPFDFRKTEPSGWVVIEPLYTHPSPAASVTDVRSVFFGTVNVTWRQDAESPYKWRLIESRLAAQENPNG